jgi:hypothetical protein
MRINARIQAIAEEAERLPAADRVKLVEYLLATLDKPGNRSGLGRRVQAAEGQVLAR